MTTKINRIKSTLRESIEMASKATPVRSTSSMAASGRSTGQIPLAFASLSQVQDFTSPSQLSFLDMTLHFSSSLSKPSLPTDLILAVYHLPHEGIRAASVIPALALMAELGQVNIRDIEKQLCVTYTTARKTLAALENAGLVTVERKSNGSKGKEKNIYSIKK